MSPLAIWTAGPLYACAVQCTPNMNSFLVKTRCGHTIFGSLQDCCTSNPCPPLLALLELVTVNFDFSLYSCPPGRELNVEAKIHVLLKMFSVVLLVHCPPPPVY